MRYFTLSIFGIFFLLCSCTQTADKTSDISKTDSLISKANISIADTTYAIIQNDSAKPISLSSEEIKEIEKIVVDVINKYNVEEETTFNKMKKEYPEKKYDKSDFIIDLNQYKRQYIPSINSKGEKEVLINCFCSYMDTDWKKDIVIVEDGGNCFFRLTINLSTKKADRLMINGIA
ncbi:MAG: hypothetical protein ACXVPU_13435 [Bacteroidia bacterium]